MRPSFDLSFYLVLDPALCGGYEATVRTALAAVAGGATMVQLRDKEASTSRMVETAQRLKAALAGKAALLIINDDVEAAIASKADGLHIGQQDMPVAEARRRIGERMILGLSVETAERAAAIDPGRVDYAGIGPVFATPTKPDHQPPLRLDGLGRLAALSPVPSVAIGGLKATHAQAVFAAGAQGMAVVSAICGTPDPSAAAEIITQAIQRGKNLASQRS